MFISSTKYRSHAIKEPFRHRPTFIAFYRQKGRWYKKLRFLLSLRDTRNTSLYTTKFLQAPIIPEREAFFF